MRRRGAPSAARRARYCPGRRALPTPHGPALSTPPLRPRWIRCILRSSPARPTSGHSARIPPVSHTSAYRAPGCQLSSGSNAPLSTPYSCWGDRPGGLLHQAGRDRRSRGVGDEALGAAGAAARSRPGWTSVTGTPDDLDRFRLVASAMAGRPLTLEPAAHDAPGYTGGRVVYLQAGG